MTSVDTLPYIMKTVSALAIVVGLMGLVAYGAKRFLVKKGGGPFSDDAITIVASRYVGSKMSVALIEVLGTYLVVGLTPQRISLLSRLDDEESFERIKNMKKPKDQALAFGEHLRRCTSKIMPFHSMTDGNSIEDAK